MFTVEFEDKLIKVKFQHFMSGVGKKRRFNSRCLFRIILDVNAGEEIDLESTVKYNPYDKEFSKNLGKKHALQKVMKDANFNGYLNKEEREDIWDTFFCCFKNSK